MNVFQEMVVCRMIDLETMDMACRMKREKKYKNKRNRKHEDNV